MTTPEPPPERRPDASMSLLRAIMDKPRDGVYDDVARRRLEGDGKRSWWQEVIVLILTIAIGAGGVWAAKQLRAPVTSNLSARSVLQEQIADRTGIGEGLRKEIRDLKAEIEELESATSTPRDEERTRRAELAGVHAGTTAVQGPGIEVTLDESDQPTSAEEHVLDVDLQIVVNGLWASGAEAIAINDRRLSYGTAIRRAGEVILVDLQPVQPPYVISAIGDPENLMKFFSQSSASNHLKILNSNYRIRSTIVQNPRLHLPAGNTFRMTLGEPMTVGIHGTLDVEGERL